MCVVLCFYVRNINYMFLINIVKWIILTFIVSRNNVCGYSTEVFCFTDNNCECVRDYMHCQNLPSLAELYASTKSHIGTLFILNKNDISIYDLNKELFHSLFDKISFSAEYNMQVLSTLPSSSISPSSSDSSTHSIYSIYINQTITTATLSLLGSVSSEFHARASTTRKSFLQILYTSSSPANANKFLTVQSTTSETVARTSHLTMDDKNLQHLDNAVLEHLTQSSQIEPCCNISLNTSSNFEHDRSISNICKYELEKYKLFFIFTLTTSIIIGISLCVVYLLKKRTWLSVNQFDAESMESVQMQSVQTAV